MTPPTGNGRAADRNAAIDALRGLAALLVLYSHLNPLEGIFVPSDLGRMGVLLFFIISGYCIFLAVDKYPRFRLTNFLVRRFFRLYPAYWTSMLAAITVGGFPNDTATILGNLTMVQYLFGIADMVGAYWTLFVEVIFYGVVTLLILLNLVDRAVAVRRVFYGFVALTFAVSLVRHYSAWNPPFAHLEFMATFLLGGVMYFNARDGRPATAALLPVGTFLAATLAISWLVYSGARVPVDNYGALGHFGNTLVATMLFVVGTLFLRVETRITSYLGAISYSVYLFHSMVLRAAAPLLADLGQASATLLGTALVIAGAAIVYHAVEKPFIRLGRTAVRRVTAVRPA